MTITDRNGRAFPATHCIHAIAVAKDCRECEKACYKPKRRRIAK